MTPTAYLVVEIPGTSLDQLVERIASRSGVVVRPALIVSWCRNSLGFLDEVVNAPGGAVAMEMGLDLLARALNLGQEWPCNQDEEQFEAFAAALVDAVKKHSMVDFVEP